MQRHQGCYSLTRLVLNDAMMARSYSRRLYGITYGIAMTIPLVATCPLLFDLKLQPNIESWVAELERRSCPYGHETYTHR